jgi:hypothetical protein
MESLLRGQLVAKLLKNYPTYSYPKSQYSVYKSLPLFPNLSQFNPVDTFMPHLFVTHFDITPRYFEWSQLFRFCTHFSSPNE